MIRIISNLCLATHSGRIHNLTLYAQFPPPFVSSLSCYPNNPGISYFSQDANPPNPGPTSPFIPAALSSGPKILDEEKKIRSSGPRSRKTATKAEPGARAGEFFASRSDFGASARARAPEKVVVGSTGCRPHKKYCTLARAPRTGHQPSHITSAPSYTCVPGSTRGGSVSLIDHRLGASILHKTLSCVTCIRVLRILYADPA